jgi:hypothetical protein
MKKCAIAILALLVSMPVGAINKSDLLACLRGEQPPSGVVCPNR